MFLRRPSPWVGLLALVFFTLGGEILDRGRWAFADPPPNVVMILADDVGWTDWQYDPVLNPTGSVVYETPNLLQLAQQSVIFKNAYAACPVCSPTRASIITGKTPTRIGLTNFVPGNPNTSATLREPYSWPRIVPPAEVTLADSLKAAGYSTGFFGKWHMGVGGGDWGSDPLQYGFDVNVGGNNYGGPDGGGGWFAGADGAWTGMPGLDTPGQYPTDKYLTDAMDEKMSAYIQQHAGAPFFLADWNFQSHIPLEAPAALVSKYQTKINTLQGQGIDLKGQTNATYAAMIEELDKSVGVTLQRLNDPNGDGNTSDSIRNNTIIIYASDNGGTYSAEGNPTRNLPLREGKGSIYEGGIRVPEMISWTGNPNFAQGTYTAARTSTYDLYPTILDLTGLANNQAIPRDTNMDGVSIRAALEGGVFDRGFLYWHYPHRSNQDLDSPLINGGSFVSAVSEGDWKLIFFYEDRHYELYNLTSDIGETTNLLVYNPAIAHNLSQALQAYLLSVSAQMPVSRANGLPVAAPPVLASQVTGDYNNDGVVNAADYTLWRTEFGSTTHLAADGNGNGVVDIADYVLWRNIMSGGGAGLGSNLAAVPEPGSATIFAIGCFLASAAYPTRFRRRRNSM